MPGDDGTQRELGALHATMGALGERMDRHEKQADTGFRDLREGQATLAISMNQLEQRLAKMDGRRVGVDWFAHAISTAVGVALSVAAFFGLTHH